MKALDVWRRVNDCRGSADSDVSAASAWQKSWNDCAAGSLTLVLTDGGHGIPKGWFDRSLHRFEQLDSQRSEPAE